MKVMIIVLTLYLSWRAIIARLCGKVNAWGEMIWNGFNLISSLLALIILEIVLGIDNLVF